MEDLLNEFFSNDHIPCNNFWRSLWKDSTGCIFVKYPGQIPKKMLKSFFEKKKCVERFMEFMNTYIKRILGKMNVRFLVQYLVGDLEEIPKKMEEYLKKSFDEENNGIIFSGILTWYPGVSWLKKHLEESFKKCWWNHCINPWNNSSWSHENS